MRFLIIVGVIVIAFVIYLLGNLAIGIEHYGGFRSVSFAIGMLLSTLGGCLIHARPEGWIIFGGITVALFGVYMILLSFFASNRKIEKIIMSIAKGIPF